ncbi:helix-turn-helix transcriptional regulator [Methanohalophilus sp.]
MQSSLSDTIWLSEKRKRLLLLLMEGPRNIDQIKTSLNVTSKAMMPQIKILREQNLIIEEDRVYRLSDIGEIIVKNMIPLLKTLGVIEENNDYWATRDLSSIPEELDSRLGDIGECMVIEPDMNHLFDLPEEFSKNLIKSNKVMTIMAYFHPLYPDLYYELANNGVQIDIILTEPIYKRMKEEHTDKFRHIVEREHTNLYICNEVNLTSVVTDRFIYLCLFNKNDMYDHKKIMSFDSSALQWGTELYDHFRQKSTLIDWDFPELND